MSTEETITRRGIEIALTDGLTRYMTERTETRGLPVLSWSVSAVPAHGHVQEISGMASSAYHLDPVKVVGAYADSFGVETAVRPSETLPTLQCVFEVDGVTVTVWGPIPVEGSDG